MYNESFIKPTRLVEAKNELAWTMSSFVSGLWFALMGPVVQSLMRVASSDPDAFDLSKIVNTAARQSPVGAFVKSVRVAQKNGVLGVAIETVPVPLEGPLEVFLTDHNGNPTNFEGIALDVFIVTDPDYPTRATAVINGNPPKGIVAIYCSIANLPTENLDEFFLHESTHLIDGLSALRDSRRSVSKFFGNRVTGRAVDNRVGSASLKPWPGIKSVISAAIRVNPRLREQEPELIQHFNNLLYVLDPAELRAFTAKHSQRLVRDVFPRFAGVYTGPNKKEMFLRLISTPYANLRNDMLGDVLKDMYDVPMQVAVNALETTDDEAYKFLNDVGAIRFIQQELVDQTRKYLSEV